MNVQHSVACESSKNNAERSTGAGVGVEFEPTGEELSGEPMTLDAAIAALTALRRQHGGSAVLMVGSAQRGRTLDVLDIRAEGDASDGAFVRVCVQSPG